MLFTYYVNCQFFQWYATAKNHKTKSREDILFKEISRLEKELDENTGLSDTQKSLLQSSLGNLKSEMEEIIEYKGRRVTVKNPMV